MNIVSGITQSFTFHRVFSINQSTTLNTFKVVQVYLTTKPYKADHTMRIAWSNKPAHNDRSTCAQWPASGHMYPKQTLYSSHGQHTQPYDMSTSNRLKSPLSDLFDRRPVNLIWCWIWREKIASAYFFEILVSYLKCGIECKKKFIGGSRGGQRQGRTKWLPVWEILDPPLYSGGTCA